MSDDLQKIKEMNELINDEKFQKEIDSQRIHNPAKELTNCITSFVASRIERIESDAQFNDLVKLYIRQRLPEASFDQLMKLNHETAQDNTEAMDKIMKLFRNETSGKTLIDNVRNNDTESLASKIYSETESKDILQALNYFTQVMEKITNNDNIEKQ